jgi:hypothetical protein
VAKSCEYKKENRLIQAVFADNATVIGDWQFFLDDIVVKSLAYRQAITAAM